MKNIFETKTKASFLAIILSIAVFVMPFVHADTTTDNAVDNLKQQKDQTQQKLDDIKKQIQTYQAQIGAISKQATSLKNEILIYDKEIALTELQIEANNTQIGDTNLQIDELQKLIDQKKNEIAQNKKILAEMIVQLNQYSDQYDLRMTLGSDSFSSFLDQVQYTQDYQGQVYQLVQKIKELEVLLQTQQDNLKVQLKRLEELKEQLVQAQSSLNDQKRQKQALLDQTRGLEKNYQKLLATSNKEEADLQAEVNSLDSEIRSKLGNKTIAPSSGSLAWPLDGVLTQGYGKTGFTSLGYNSHNGIDIAAPAGSPMYAAAGGTVLDTDYSDTSYGNWAAIKHTITTASGSRQIVTLYGHMRTIKVVPGQIVEQGDLVGYEGNTGNTTKKLYGPERGYHLHFGVYDAEGFGIATGAYTKIYGPYKVPYGYTYNPLNFLP
jgi:murein DD-endopeptidase MepM/ murein hydrolase activator NlpD